MNREHVKKLLTDVREQSLSVEDAYQRLRNLPYEDLGFAKIDHHRALRRGFPEVVFCQGKTSEQVLKIVDTMQKSDVVLATRASREIFERIREKYSTAEFNETARTIVVRNNKPATNGRAKIMVLSAGTSDIPVAEEAAVTADVMGNPVDRAYDIGVAGLHRLLDQRDKIAHAGVIVVVAGMDGVLPTVVSGLVDKPVIAVPTSVGYGAGFQGLAPLLTMMNSCSPGVVVVNIDNGFGAGYFASLINQLASSSSK